MSVDQEEQQPCENKEVWWDGLLLHTTELLGCGSYGSVFRAKGEDGSSFAAKFYKSGKNEVQSELDVFRMLTHPNVVVCYGVVTTSSEIGLLMEIGQGSLGQYLKQHPLLEPLEPAKMLQRWQLATQLAKGLHHIHSRGLVHADPKPSNAIIFASPSLAAKWSDLGLCQKANEKVFGENVFTPAYRAPEYLSGKVIRLTKSADAFAFGCVLFSCCCLGGGGHLFVDVSVVGNSQYVQARLSAAVPHDFAAQTMIKALVSDVAERATLLDFLSAASRRLRSF
ncbi:LRK10L-1.3 [Symbiodinium natans]|uniref:LRK10L-1.3 protein n=1 Tax=Symbiodinium natans TaxID=878477 RepID=A0A812T8F2_9DINO|nr:LRK10L-1.3 [Symbiodinium natans]